MRLLTLLGILVHPLFSFSQSQPVLNSRTGVGFVSIQDAIEASFSGDTLHLKPIRFTERVSIDSSIVILGHPEGGTILDIRDQIGYGVHVRSGSPTIEHLTIQSNLAHQNYAIHSEPGVTGLVLRHIRVIGNATSGIDLNGLTSEKENVVESCQVMYSGAGFGLALSSCQNVKVKDFTSLGNGNGDIGILESAYTTNRTESLRFSGDLKLLGVNGNGLGGIVIQSDSTIVTPGFGAEYDIDMQGEFVHKLTAVSDFDGAPLGYLLCNTDNAPALSLALGSFPGVNQLVSRNVITNALEVWPGMLLQDAIDIAIPEETIRIMLPGTYDSARVDIDRPVTILGPNDGLAAGHTDRGEEARLLQGVTVVSSNVTLNGVSIHTGSDAGHGVVIEQGAEEVSLLNTIIRGGSDAGLPTEVDGIRSMGNVYLSHSLIQGWHAGIVVEQGRLTLSECDVMDNAVGLQFESNGMAPTRMEALGVELLNVGGDAIVVTAAESGDSLLLSSCTGRLHRHSLRFDVPVDYAIADNSFAKAERHVEGVSNDARIGLCAQNAFGTPDLFIVGCMDQLAINYEPCAVSDPNLCIYPGCTDPLSCNYDAGANQENGSCEFNSCAGCMNPLACNFDESAQVAGECDFLSCRGCTDGNALNYSAFATQDDGSCQIAGCTDPEGDNFNPNATLDNGACAYFGCTDSLACNYDAASNYDDGSCETTSCAGCTDPRACSFDELATLDDGSCDYLSCRGCTQSAAVNFDPAASVDDGSCRILDCAHPLAELGACDDNGTEGCTDSVACNYNVHATLDNGTCDFESCLGCTDNAACNFDASAVIQDGSCTYAACVGCTDPNACNYSPDATVNLGCLLPLDVHGSTNVDCNGVCEQDSDGDGVCDADEGEGCTNLAACNFNPMATEENGSCEFMSCAGCTDAQACNYEAEATALAVGSCDYTSCVGCLLEGSCNYDPEATVSSTCVSSPGGHLDCSGSCLSDIDSDGICDLFEVLGCTDPTACNFEGEATDEDGSCTYVDCTGCTNPGACNFNTTATLNDGSCNYDPCTGCTDEEACNYASGADEDDGSCTYALDLWNNSSLNCAGECFMDADGDGVCDPDEQWGCTEISACNFSPLAEFEDGSCEFTSCAGCTDASACNYNDAVSIDDGTCSTPLSLYGSDAYDCLGTCVQDADGDDVCDEFEIAGCLDSSACNYDPNATDPAECNYPDPFYDCDNVCFQDSDGDGVCDDFEVVGCIDPFACNYVPAATDAADCIYPDFDYLDCDGNCLEDSDGDGICDPIDVDQCLGDFNNDGMRSASDILTILAGFRCESECGDLDLDGDGIVAITDILFMLTVFGTFCPE